MSIRKVIDLEIQRQSGEMVGNIASQFYQFYTETGTWSWACDVDIGTDNVLRNVIIDAAAKNDVLRWGETGTPVVMKKMCNDRWSIIGISPVKLSRRHFIYVTFTDSIGKIVRDEYKERVIRPLTFEEIGIYAGGWGECPFGAYGHFNADGEFVELIS